MLVSGRARLYDNRIELSGWSFRGRFHRRLELDAVENVEWFTAVKGRPNLCVVMEGGAEHYFWVQAAGTWCYEIRKLVGVSEDSPALPAPRRRIADAA